MKKIQLLSFQPKISAELEIINVGDTIDDSISKPFRTDFYQILWFYSGEMTVYIDFKPVKIPPNTVLFLNKLVVQFYEFTGDIKADIMLFTENFTSGSSGSVSNGNYLDRSLLFNDLIQAPMVEGNKQLAIIWDLILDEYHNGEDSFKLPILKNQLHNFILIAEREINSQEVSRYTGTDFDVYTKFKVLLEKEFKTQKGIQFYKNELNITEKRLNKAVVSVVGKTSKEMINNRIVLEAKRLLSSNTSESVKFIGIELGFSETTNFVKFFKKHTKMTPMCFRRGFHKGLN